MKIKKFIRLCLAVACVTSAPFINSLSVEEASAKEVKCNVEYPLETCKD